MKVAAKAIEMKSKGEVVFDLSVGEPDFTTPDNIKEAAKKAIDLNKTKYTLNQGTVELRQAISEKLKKDNSLDYGPDEIIVSSGAKQSLFNAIQSIIYVNDEVIIPAPYWVSYPQMVTLAHGKSVIVGTKEENGFKITPEQLSGAVNSNTKALILCNPSNPTGSAYSRKEMEKLAEVLEDKDIYIIADEIYEKLVYDNMEFASFASVNKKLKDRTILINGFSKAYAMTGWRIGYAAGHSEIIQGLSKIQSHSTSGPSSISQFAALEALYGSQDSIEYMRTKFEERRNYLHQEINGIEGISCNLPAGAFYLFPNVSSYFGKENDIFKIENSFDLSMYLLYQAKTAVVPGSAFGMEGYIRLSYAASMDNLEAAVDNIKKSLLLLD